MENNANVLKPSKQKIVLMGTLKEKNLTKGTSEKGEYISGKIIVTAADGSDVMVQLYANKEVTDKQTQQKKENKLYTNYEAIMNDYISSAEIAAQNLTDKVPTQVSVRGASFDKNDYFNKRTNNIVEGTVIKATAVSQARADQIVPEATFEIVAYLQKMTNEIKDGLETGRKKCTLLFPIYGGKLASMNVVCSEVVSAGLEGCGVGKTYNFIGSIKNIVTEVKKVTPGLAGDIVKVFTNTTREYLVTNVPLQASGSAAFDESSEDYLAPEAIQIALSDREAALAQLKQESEAAW
jgi:hypothetical protein